MTSNSIRIAKKWSLWMIFIVLISNIPFLIKMGLTTEFFARIALLTVFYGGLVFIVVWAVISLKERFSVKNED